MYIYIYKIMRMKTLLKMAWRIPQPLPYVAFPVLQILPVGLNKKISTFICHLLINQSSKNKQGTASTCYKEERENKGAKGEDLLQSTTPSAVKCWRAVSSFSFPSFPRRLPLLPPRSCLLDEFFPFSAAQETVTKRGIAQDSTTVLWV